jgi:hypothetical protein
VNLYHIKKFSVPIQYLIFPYYVFLNYPKWIINQLKLLGHFLLKKELLPHINKRTKKDVRTWLLNFDLSLNDWYYYIEYIYTRQITSILIYI